MRYKNTLMIFFLIVFQGLSAQEVLKTMVYNLLNFPTAPPANRELILKDILDEFEPDLFMVNELESELGADLILNESILPSRPYFERSAFIPIQSDPDTDNPLQHVVYYNTFKLELIAEELYKTTVRDINRYKFLLNTEEKEINPIYLEVFVTHLKSSSGTANNQMRLDAIEVLMNALENEYANDEQHSPIEPDSYVLFAGDMNFYTSSEPGYQKLRNADQESLRTFVDVLNPDNVLQSWTGNNVNWRPMHTQSTRATQFGGYGAGSGMDDRFDFIFITDNMFDNPELEYVEDSYKAIGNNGNCHDLSINDESCLGEYSQELRDLLYYMSDHTPVVMDLQTNQVFLSNPELTNTELIYFPEGNIPNQTLTVEVDPSIAQNIQFKAYNVLGQEVMHITNMGTTQYSIDVTSLSNGVYYLSTNNPSGKTYKFLKTN